MTDPGDLSDAWLVIPTYNEASIIGAVVAEARERFAHVLCVDDGSTDGSAERARLAGAVVVRHPVNLGQGAALQTGFEYVLGQTDARYLVTFDADGQHDVLDAEAMVRLARERGWPSSSARGSSTSAPDRGGPGGRCSRRRCG